MLPIAAGSRDAPTTATTRGRSTGASELATAMRSRSSARSRCAAAPATGSSTWTASAPHTRCTTNPESLNTRIIAWFSGNTSALSSTNPAAAVMPARRSRIRLEIPRPWNSSSTRNAISALRPSPVAMKLPRPTTCSPPSSATVARTQPRSRKSPAHSASIVPRDTSATLAMKRMRRLSRDTRRVNASSSETSAGEAARSSSPWPSFSRTCSRYAAPSGITRNIVPSNLTSYWRLCGGGLEAAAAQSLQDILRICSTISGLASVVTSPTSAKLEIAAITRRMILPDRVLGMSGTIQTCFGRAILPISVSIASR